MVSLIIPFYNRAHIIEETLQSLLKQTSSNWECVLIDDGSTDNTEIVLDQYLNKDKRFRLFKRPEHRKKGPSTCRNIGLENAKGDYIIFLDSDDILAPFCVEERLKAFQKFPNQDFLVFKMNTFSDKIPDLKHNNLNERKNEDWLCNFIQFKSSWQITSPIYKKDFILNLKGFEEDLAVFEDLFLASKVIYHAKQFKVFTNTDCFYRNNNDYFEKHKNESYILKINESFFKLIKIYTTTLILNENKIYRKRELKDALVKGYVTILNAYIVPLFPKVKSNNRLIINYLLKNKYIKKDKYFRLLLAHNILKKCYNIKGLGLFRIINRLIK
jgi:glycosyltransferase involved in cell wall biosynthesis